MTERTQPPEPETKTTPKTNEKPIKNETRSAWERRHLSHCYAPGYHDRMAHAGELIRR
jgi:hypothetical protein